MDLERKIFSTTLGKEKIKLEVSRLAGQANAAVLGKYGETAVLATVVMGETNPSKDYFPLSVDYEERFYAAGKILGSRFMRREGRPSEEAILLGRLIDRTIRPLFDEAFKREVQVTITALSYDGVNAIDPIAMLAASTALSISDIPWNGPAAGILFEKLNDDGSLLYRGFFAGPKGKINMMELEGINVQEDELLKVFTDSNKEIDRLITFQEDIVKKIGKEKITFVKPKLSTELRERVKKFIVPHIKEKLRNHRLHELLAELTTSLTEAGESEENLSQTPMLFEHIINEMVREAVLSDSERPDGRKLDQIRDLYAEVGLFSQTHGTGLFIRGETQLLAVTTLGSPSAEQLVETMEGLTKRRFMLHYNFPNFSTGEIGRARSPGRREIGHGALALKAVENMLPSKDAFPYTIRVVAETLSSNGWRLCVQQHSRLWMLVFLLRALSLASRWVLYIRKMTNIRCSLIFKVRKITTVTWI